MRHIVASGNWFFSNLGTSSVGYGFARVGYPKKGGKLLDGEIRMFVPLLMVDGAPTAPSYMIFLDDPHGGAIGDHLVFPLEEEEEAKRRQQQVESRKIYRGVSYPPPLAAHQFRIEERDSEFVAVPAPTTEDNLCLLFFGGDSGFSTLETPTSGKILRTAYTTDDFLGMAVLKPGDMVTLFRGGWTHTHRGYVWNGQELQVLYHIEEIDQYRKTREVLTAEVH